MRRLDPFDLRLTLPLALFLAAALLYLRADVLSQWMKRSLEWREVRTVEIAEKDFWSLARESVDATEGSGWLSYRLFYALRGERESGGHGQRGWGLFFMALALACWSLYFLPAARAQPVSPPTPLVKGGGVAPLLFGTLLVLAGPAWIPIGASLTPSALVPAAWCGWLLWAGRFVEAPRLRMIAVGALVAAVVVHVHMLFVLFVPFTMLLVLALLAVPQRAESPPAPLVKGGGESMALGARLRRGFWALLFVVGAAALSVGPFLLRAHELRPLHFTFKAPAQGWDDLLRQLVQVHSARPWAVLLITCLALAGLGVAFRRQRRAAILWILGWIAFGFLVAKLRWGSLDAPESAPLELLLLPQWFAPAPAMLGLFAIARWIAGVAPAGRTRATVQRGLPALAVVGSLAVVFSAAGPRAPQVPDWDGLAAFLSQRAGPEDRILLYGPDTLLRREDYACVLAPFRHTPLLPRLARFPASASLLSHLASDCRRLWILRFGAADWPMTLRYQMETRAAYQGNFGGVGLFQFPTEGYRNLVSGVHTQWRPKLFDLPALGKGQGLRVVELPTGPAVDLRVGGHLDLTLSFEKAGAYNVRVFLANVSTSTGTLDFKINDVLIHSAQLPARREPQPSDFSLYFQEGAARLTLAAGGGGRFLLSRLEIGRNRLGLVPEIRHPRDVVFGQSLRFLGYTYASDVVPPAHTMEVSYYWEAMRKLEEPLSVIVRADHLAADGAFHRFGNDHDFMLGQVPPESLVPGEILKETLVLDVPPEAPQLPYKLMLGVISQHGLGVFRRDRPLGPPHKLVGVFDYESDRIQVGMIEVDRSQKSQFILLRPTPRDPLIFKFTPEIDFIGFDMRRTALSGAVEFEMSLYFHCLTALRENYDIVTTVTGPGSRILLTERHQPCLSGFYPTSLWEAGQKIRDTYTFRVPTGEAERVDLNIALIESHPSPGQPPRQLGKMIQLTDYGLRQVE